MIFYVYTYTCPIRNEIIYVGKGKLKRAFKHLRRKDMHPLTQRIGWIRKQGKEPIVTLQFTDLEEELAFLVESEMILKYGRKDLNTGPLLNLTDGGQGTSGAKHPMKLEHRLAMLGREQTDEKRELCRIKQTGRKDPPEVVAKKKAVAQERGKRMAVEMKGKMAPCSRRASCLFCRKETTIGALPQFHKRCDKK